MPAGSRQAVDPKPKSHSSLHCHLPTAPPAVRGRYYNPAPSHLHQPGLQTAESVIHEVPQALSHQRTGDRRGHSDDLKAPTGNNSSSCFSAAGETPADSPAGSPGQLKCHQNGHLNPLPHSLRNSMQHFRWFFREEPVFRYM